MGRRVTLGNSLRRVVVSVLVTVAGAAPGSDKVFERNHVGGNAGEILEDILIHRWDDVGRRAVTAVVWEKCRCPWRLFVKRMYFQPAYSYVCQIEETSHQTEKPFTALEWPTNIHSWPRSMLDRSAKSGTSWGRPIGNTIVVVCVVAMVTRTCCCIKSHWQSLECSARNPLIQLQRPVMCISEQLFRRCNRMHKNTVRNSNSKRESGEKTMQRNESHFIPTRLQESRKSKS